MENNMADETDNNVTALLRKDVERYKALYEREQQRSAEFQRHSKEMQADMEEQLKQRDRKIAELKATKMRLMGDVFHNLSKMATGERREELVEEADRAYQQALDMAEKSLEAKHPLRLYLSLDYAVFLREIKSVPDQALQLLRKLWDELIDQMLSEQNTDIAPMLKFLRDRVKEGTGGEEHNSR